MTGLEASAVLKSKLQEHGLYNQNELNTLFLAATGRDRLSLMRDSLSAAEEQALFSLLQRRIDGEPLQYLLGSWPFLDFTVKVDARALIPRPETELLAETCVKLCAFTRPERILDLCSGTGVLAFALKRAFPSADVDAVELSTDAFSLLQENAALLGCNINAICADANAHVASLADNSIDLIVSNPPYVTEQDYAENLSELCHEPKMAFVAEEEGLYFYRTLIPACYRVLKEGGVLAFEIGEEQGEAVRNLFENSGYCDITLLRDFSGLDRVVYAKKT